MRRRVGAIVPGRGYVRAEDIEEPHTFGEACNWAEGHTGRLVSNAIPPNHPDAPRVDSQGRACFQSKREIDEFMAKNPEWSRSRDCGGIAEDIANRASQIDIDRKEMAAREAEMRWIEARGL